MITRGTQLNFIDKVNNCFMCNKVKGKLFNLGFQSTFCLCESCHKSHKKLFNDMHLYEIYLKSGKDITNKEFKIAQTCYDYSLQHMKEECSHADYVCDCGDMVDINDIFDTLYCDDCMDIQMPFMQCIVEKYIDIPMLMCNCNNEEHICFSKCKKLGPQKCVNEKPDYNINVFNGCDFKLYSNNDYNCTINKFEWSFRTALYRDDESENKWLFEIEIYLGRNDNKLSHDYISGLIDDYTEQYLFIASSDMSITTNESTYCGNKDHNVKWLTNGMCNYPDDIISWFKTTISSL